MTTRDIRDESHQLLDRIDERFLAAVHALLRTYEQEENAQPVADKGVVGYRAGKAIYVEELRDRVAAAEDQIDRGEFLTTQELEKETEEWLSNIG